MCEAVCEILQDEHKSIIRGRVTTLLVHAALFPIVRHCHSNARYRILLSLAGITLAVVVEVKSSLSTPHDSAAALSYVITAPGRLLNNTSTPFFTCIGPCLQLSGY